MFRGKTMGFEMGILKLQQGCLLSIFIYLEGNGYMTKDGKRQMLL